MCVCTRVHVILLNYRHRWRFYVVRYGLRVDSTFQAALRIVSRATPELAIVREIMEVRPVVAMFLMSVSLMVDDDA